MLADISGKAGVEKAGVRPVGIEVAIGNAGIVAVLAAKLDLEVGMAMTVDVSEPGRVKEIGRAHV